MDRRGAEGADAGTLPAGSVIARFEVPHRPRAWRVPKVTRTGAAIKDAELVAWQETVALFARMAMAGKRPYLGPVRLTLRFRIAHRPGPIPDVTNMAKSTEDAIQGIVIGNDREVASLDASRDRADADGVTILVTAL